MICNWNNSTLDRDLLRSSFLLVLFFLMYGAKTASAQISYTDVNATGAWSSNRWNNSTDGPTYLSTYTANNTVNFTSGNYTFAGMGAVINVGDIDVASGANVTFSSASSTFATNGSVRTITVAGGATINFAGQSFSTASGTGFIKNGDGVLALAGNTYNGGFTLNAGTLIARSVNAMGGDATNVLTLNGGTVASNASRVFDNTKFGGGIVIGGTVQFGELSTNVALASSTANLTFANDVSLGAANRTLTLGNNGRQIFSGVISNTGSGGITFAANSGTTGRFEFTNTANTFTGDITIIGGTVFFTGDGSLGNAANDILIDGGEFSKASDATTVILGAGRQVFVGDNLGTAIRSPNTGTLVINSGIADLAGETGSWAKEGSGTLELGGMSTYTGSTAINNGTVLLTTGNNRLPTSTVVSMGQASGNFLGTLDLNGFNQEIAGLNSTTGTNATASNNTVTSTNPATLTISGSGTYSYGDGTDANSGVITGALSLVKSGTGSQTLGDTNTYTGNTTVLNGDLLIGSSGSIDSSSNPSSQLNVSGGSLKIATGGSVKVGASANGSGTGSIQVNGTLEAPMITMSGSSTLSGTGTVKGDTTVNALATLAAGNSIGTITIDGDLSLLGTYEWELDNVLNSADLTNVIGNLDLTGATLNILQTGTATIGDKYTLFGYTGIVSGGFVNPISGWLINYADATAGINGGSGSAFVTITAIPEPSSLAVLGLVGVGSSLVARYRRKRTSRQSK